MSRNLAVLVGYCLTFGVVAVASAQAPTPGAPTATPAATVAAAPTPDPKVFGEYPLAYQEIITRWLETKLADPASAVVDWTDKPKAGEYKTQKGETFVGYVVDFKVNARNQFGGATGKQRYRVVIRNGQVTWGGHPRY